MRRLRTILRQRQRTRMVLMIMITKTKKRRRRKCKRSVLGSIMIIIVARNRRCIRFADKSVHIYGINNLYLWVSM